MPPKHIPQVSAGTYRVGSHMVTLSQTNFLALRAILCGLTNEPRYKVSLRHGTGTATVAISARGSQTQINPLSAVNMLTKLKKVLRLNEIDKATDAEEEEATTNEEEDQVTACGKSYSTSNFDNNSDDEGEDDDDEDANNKYTYGTGYKREKKQKRTASLSTNNLGSQKKPKFDLQKKENTHSARKPKLDVMEADEKGNEDEEKVNEDKEKNDDDADVLILSWKTLHSVDMEFKADGPAPPTAEETNAAKGRDSPDWFKQAYESF